MSRTTFSTSTYLVVRHPYSISMMKKPTNMVTSQRHQSNLSCISTSFLSAKLQIKTNRNNFLVPTLFSKISKVKKNHHPIKDDGLTKVLFVPLSSRLPSNNLSIVTYDLPVLYAPYSTKPPMQIYSLFRVIIHNRIEKGNS